jgi:biotin synthase
MQIDQNIERILERAQAGIAPDRADCIALLEVSPSSIEASFIRAVGDQVTRRRFQSEAMILGQIGLEIDVCPGRCKFCSFGDGHTRFTPSRMTLDEILASASRFTSSGDLYALFLMTMHDFRFERLLESVQAIRKIVPTRQQIVVNIGDFDRKQADELRHVGVNGAYHVCRLREGSDTSLDPEQRKKTIQAIKDAGLDWYYCCEPVGPEHGAAELVEQIFLGIEYGCFQHAAMRRVYLPDTPLAGFGQISELRLGLVVAVVALASLASRETRNIAVHEPNLIGLTSGANVVYAETGANPRDTEKDTSLHRGRDVRDCKAMLYEAGFDRLLVTPGEQRPLGETFR